jgi:hypothetical protein
VAIHEAGHALVAALSQHTDPVAKVTILPAGQALGVTEQLPLVERHLYGEDYLLDSLAVRLGGRAAELVVLGQGSTGAANDLAGATDLATKMVREFGLSKALGPVGYPTGGSVFLGGGGSELSSRPFAEATQAAIDSEVAQLLRDAEARAIDVLSSHRLQLDASSTSSWTRRRSTARRCTALPAGPCRPKPAGRSWPRSEPRPPTTRLGHRLTSRPARSERQPKTSLSAGSRTEKGGSGRRVAVRWAPDSNTTTPNPQTPLTSAPR